MNNLTAFLTVANLIFLLASVFGGYLVIKTTLARSEVDIQTRVREALADENEMLVEKVKRIEQDLRAYRGQVRSLLEALKTRYGLDITLDPDVVVIRDKQSTQIIPLHDDSPEKP